MTSDDQAIYSTSVPKPWLIGEQSSDGASLLWVEQLFPASVMAAARDLVLNPEALVLDRDADSVDGSPTLEVMWMMEGKFLHPALADIFRETVETRLVPLIQRSPELHGLADGRRLVLCEALLRVYEDGQRRVHPAHYDRDALVTAMLEIDTRCNEALLDHAPVEHPHLPDDGKSMVVASNRTGVHGFEGLGFYVQPGAHVNSRMPIVMAPGDVIAHSFDLQHGVEVSSGRRCSVIFWFVDSAGNA